MVLYGNYPKIEDIVAKFVRERSVGDRYRGKPGSFRSDDLAGGRPKQAIAPKFMLSGAVFCKYLCREVANGMALERNLWEKAVDFHGHVCMGLARGCRVAQAAMQVFKERDIDEELVAIVENDSCSIDAIQVLIGCTLGKGNLIYRDYGKSVYTFIRRRDKKAIRVTLQDYPKKAAPS